LIKEILSTGGFLFDRKCMNRSGFGLWLLSVKYLL
jgi:hypothetical protein